MTADTAVAEQEQTQDQGVDVQETTKESFEHIDDFNGEKFILHGKEITKGTRKGGINYILEPLENQSRWDYIQSYRRAVGAENFDKVIAKMIQEDCKDASLQAAKKAEDGIVTDEGLLSALVEGYVDSTRRGGPHVKDIKEKIAAVFAELNPLITRAFTKGADPLSDAEHNKMIQLGVEFSDLQKSLEEVQGARKGKKKTAKGETAAAAAK